MNDDLKVLVTKIPTGVIFTGTYAEYKLWAPTNRPARVKIHYLAPTKVD